MSRCALVLSGGFLRSAFQVGVVEALTARGVHFDMVVGVSSGAWNAVCVAAGQIGEMRRWWMEVAAAPKISFRNLWRNRTVLNFPAIVSSIPARQVRFDRAGRSPVRLCVGATRLRSWTFHLFDSAEGPHDFFRIAMASSYLPGVYGAPIRVGGHYYADGGLVDNVPYEAALRAGCEEIYVVVPETGGSFRKHLFAHRPHRIEPSLRDRVTLVYPERPLPAGRLAASPEAIRDCIDAGRDAAARVRMKTGKEHTR